jgi:uncharacterized protein YdhG (YjbR/CyaY superfamily)
MARNRDGDEPTRAMNVDDYLETAPEPQRTTLNALRGKLAALLPGAEQAMSYGVPAFTVNGAAVAGYAYAKRHCSYYPHSGSVLSQVAPELLAGYDWSRGTLRFPVDQLPSDDLLQRLVEIRLAMLAER